MISIPFQHLAPKQLIEVLTNLHNYTITEQLDGMEVVVGFERNSTLYVKCAKGDCYDDLNQFPDSHSMNGLRSVFKALLTVRHLLHIIIGDDSAVRCKILYGKQPNVISYGDNRIVFEEVIFASGDYKRIMKELSTLSMNPVSVETVVCYTNNGTELLSGTEHHMWLFNVLPIIWSFDEIFTIEDLNPEISGELTALRNWLTRKGTVVSIPSPTVTPKTNGEYFDIDPNVLSPTESVSINHIKKSVHHYYHQVFITSIHDSIISWLMYDKPSVFASIPSKPLDYTGIKGITLTHKETGFAIDIDNEPHFSRVRSFYNVIRNNIFSTEKYEDFNIIVGVSKNVIGELLHKLYDAFHDVHYDSTFTVQQLINTKHVLERMLVDYMRTFKYFRLGLSTGQEIGYTDSVHYQTLVCFAETFDKLRDLIVSTTWDTTEQEFVKNLQDKFGKSVFK